MRTLTLASAAVIAVFSLTSASFAEETTVIHRESGPGIAVEHHEGVVEHREVTTGGSDCGSKTVHKEDGAGNSKTVHKEGCN